ncbi:unnamed protein product, partial [Brassica rapa subsp. narinosa]
AGATYTLQNFYAATSKEIYRVADQSLTVSFRFHTHEDFQANRGLRGDLYGNLSEFKNQHVVGHLRLVNGQSLSDRPVLDESEMISMRHILLYLWDQAAKDFYKKFTSSEDTPTVLLVTTVNPKTVALVFCLVFFEWALLNLCFVYCLRLSSNPQIGKQVNADEVTRVETMTIGQIFAYIKQEYAKEASFNCIATIGDVKHDSPWYYIACGGCHTKATRGPSSLMCAKCGNTNNLIFVYVYCDRYRAEISVYDSNDQAVFVLLGDAGSELTGKQAAELVANYFEVPRHQLKPPSSSLKLT